MEGHGIISPEIWSIMIRAADFGVLMLPPCVGLLIFIAYPYWLLIEVPQAQHDSMVQMSVDAIKFFEQREAETELKKVAKAGAEKYAFLEKAKGGAGGEDKAVKGLTSRAAR